MSSTRMLVIGAGMAGGRAAEALARRAPGQVTLVGAEPVPPYDRTTLSKGLLTGEASPNLWLRPQESYADRGVDLRLGARAAGLDAAAKTVRLDSGEELGFEQALLCTGATARRLPLPGAGLPGVHRLRELADATALATTLATARRCCVVGAGFIGCEVAAACRARGIDVVMLEPAPTPCAGTLGEAVGSLLANVHRAEGADVRCGDGAAAFHGEGTLEAVETVAGELVPCDAAVVGVGAVPCTGWLEGSGLLLGDGVVVDEHLETSAEGIFAVGDIASWPYRGRRVRVEHETTAQTQAMTAARCMLGRRTPYRAAPFVWSHQYDLDIWAVGDLGEWDEVAVDADGSRSLLARYLRDGEPVAVAGVNRPGELEAARRSLEPAAGQAGA